MLIYVLKGLKKNLLGIFELRQFAMNNDKVPNCNATVNVGAASMYTNAVSVFLLVLVVKRVMEL